MRRHERSSGDQGSARASGRRRRLEAARVEALNCRRCDLWRGTQTVFGAGPITAVRPKVVVALGATAAAAVLGPTVRVLRDRGRWLPSPLAPAVTLTVHPSSILRAPDREARRAAMAPFVADLRAVAGRLREGA